MNDESNIEREDATDAVPKSRFGILKRFFAILLGGYLLILLALWVFESSLIYPAPSRSRGNWQRDDIPHEEIDFLSVDGTALHGWYFEHPAPKGHLVFFHGNAQDVASLADEMHYLRDLYQISIFAFDYRGYGKSQGKPNEQGVLEDGESAQSWLADRAGIPTDQVILYGLSLGGGVAVNAASKQGARALILDRTFHSMLYVASSHYPWVPTSLLMKNRYPSSERIKAYDGPLLQMHGPPDSVVPYASGKMLFEACPSKNKKFLTIKDLGHLDRPPRKFYQELQLLFQDTQTNNPRPE